MVGLVVWGFEPLLKRTNQKLPPNQTKPPSRGKLLGGGRFDEMHLSRIRRWLPTPDIAQRFSSHSRKTVPFSLL